LHSVKIGAGGFKEGYYPPHSNRILGVIYYRKKEAVMSSEADVEKAEEREAVSDSQ